MASTVSVDSSLWWDSFAVLLTDLEGVHSSSEFPSHLSRKLEENRDWLFKLVSLFKSRNKISRDVLGSEIVKLGSHELHVRSELRSAALRMSDSLDFDEVQSYILLSRFIEKNPIASEDFLYLASLEYFNERQCLLKCARQIFMHNFSFHGTGGKQKNEMEGLITDGIDNQLLSIFQNLFPKRHTEHMDFSLVMLWAENALIEGKIVLDILFLCYYEPFCNCNMATWKKISCLYKEILSGSSVLEKVAVSVQASQWIKTIKWQLLLILIETLDLDSVLQMICDDEVPLSFSGLNFPMSNIQELDSVISDLSVSCVEDSAPLLLAWAVFVCLALSMKGRDDDRRSLFEIDRAFYIRQAFDASPSPFGYFLRILQSDCLEFSDGPSSGYKSIIRTFVSAFIASYDFSLQPEDPTVRSILDVLSSVYKGEESLCSQFWDKSSTVDGPLRRLLCSLENEFPFRILEYVRFLSALSEGRWPCECVFDFLRKSAGVSSPFDVTDIDGAHTVIAQSPLRVPDIEGLIIPEGTRGFLLRMIDEKTSLGLIRWQCNFSGTAVLLHWVAQERVVDCSDEILAALDLLCRLVSFSPIHCLSLGNIYNSIRTVDLELTEIFCAIVRTATTNTNGGNTLLISLCVRILAALLECLPSHTVSIVLKRNLFGLGAATDRGEGMMISETLSGLLLIDSQKNEGSWPLSISLLELTVQLVETGARNGFTLALVLFSIHHVFVDHDKWRYGSKRLHWKIKLKCLELVMKCAASVRYFQKRWKTVERVLLNDSSVHKAIVRVLLFSSARYLEKRSVPNEESTGSGDPANATRLVLDAIRAVLVLSDTELPAFHRFLLSPSETEPVTVVSAVISLMLCPFNPSVQISAIGVLSELLAASASHHSPDAVHFSMDDEQTEQCGRTLSSILEGPSSSEELFTALCGLCAIAASCQPAFLISIVTVKLLPGDTTFLSVLSTNLRRSGELIGTNPKKLLCVLELLLALWRYVADFPDIVRHFEDSSESMEELYRAVTSVRRNIPDEDSHLHGCRSAAFEILALDTFHPTNARIDAGDLIASLSSCVYDRGVDAETKIAGALLVLDASIRVASGDTGNLSVLVTETLREFLGNLRGLTAFSDLECSEKGDPASAVLSILRDLYSREQSDGDSAGAGPFSTLFGYVFDSKVFDVFLLKNDGDELFLFDVEEIERKLGLGLWECSGWKESVPVAGRFLDCARKTNAVRTLSSSKLSSLKALTGSIRLLNPVGDGVVRRLIDRVASVLDLLSGDRDPPGGVVEFLSAQSGALLSLLESLLGPPGVPLRAAVVRASARALTVLADLPPTARRDTVERAAGTFLTALLRVTATAAEPVPETLSLLPVLCKCVGVGLGPRRISLAAMDSVVRGLDAPETWIPVVRRHLDVNRLVSSLSRGSPEALSLLLSLARVPSAAEMLVRADVFGHLSLLLGRTTPAVWGLGVSVALAVVQSLGDRCWNLLAADGMFPYFFDELLLDHIRVEAAECTLVLLCALAKRRELWLGSRVRERCIRCLATAFDRRDFAGLLVYRNAFHLLRLLFLEADAAVRRSLEAGYLEPGRFPEMPAPDVLHGIRDHAVAVLTELCRGGMDDDARDVSVLLVRLLEMCMCLEACVSSVCDVPLLVNRRLDDFATHSRSLFGAAGGHPFLTEPMNSLHHTMSLLYSHRFLESL